MGVLLALTLASCLEILQGDHAHRALARRLHAGDHRLRTSKRGCMADAVAHGCTSNLIAIGARGGAEGRVDDERDLPIANQVECTGAFTFTICRVGFVDLGHFQTIDT